MRCARGHPAPEANACDVLQECGFDGRYATAVNEVFVPASQRAAKNLQDGDRVEVLGAMQGG